MEVNGDQSELKSQHVENTKPSYSSSWKYLNIINIISINKSYGIATTWRWVNHFLVNCSFKEASFTFSPLLANQTLLLFEKNYRNKRALMITFGQTKATEALWPCSRKWYTVHLNIKDHIKPMAFNINIRWLWNQ